MLPSCAVLPSCLFLKNCSVLREARTSLPLASHSADRAALVSGSDSAEQIVCHTHTHTRHETHTSITTPALTPMASIHVSAKRQVGGEWSHPEALE